MQKLWGGGGVAKVIKRVMKKVHFCKITFNAMGDQLRFTVLSPKSSDLPPRPLLVFKVVISKHS